MWSKISFHISNCFWFKVFLLTWAEQEGNVPRAQRATMVMKPNLLLALEIIKHFRKLNNDKTGLPKSGFEPGTFWSIVQHLNHCATEEKRFRKFWLLLRTVLLLTINSLWGCWGPQRSILTSEINSVTLFTFIPPAILPVNASTA